MTNLKLAFRTLFKAPFVTIVAILSLALGIGANAAIFSLFNQMLLRPLPVPEPQRAGQPVGARAQAGLARPATRPASCDEVFSYPMFRDLQKAQTVFTGVAAHVCSAPTSPTATRRMNGDGVLVSGSYFPVLGLQPALGRLLSPDDDQKVGESLVVVLSHAYWTSALRPQPERPQRDADRQRPAPHHRRRRAARASSGTTLGARPQVFVPITLRGVMKPGLQPVPQPPQLLGLSVRAAAAGRDDRPGAHAASTCRTAPSSTTSKRRCSEA